jgi:uncharacterized membrane protein
MKKQNQHDERIVVERRKINSEAYGILFIVLLISVLIQRYWFEAPIEQYAVELICFLGVSVYTLIRYMMIGHDLFGEGKRAKYIPLLNSIVVGIVVAVNNVVLNYPKNAEYYSDNIGMFVFILAINFVSVVVLTFALLSCLSYLNKRKQAKILEQLEDDEQQG